MAVAGAGSFVIGLSRPPPHQAAASEVLSVHFAPASIGVTITPEYFGRRKWEDDGNVHVVSSAHFDSQIQCREDSALLRGGGVSVCVDV